MRKSFLPAFAAISGSIALIFLIGVLTQAVVSASGVTPVDNTPPRKAIPPVSLGERPKWTPTPNHMAMPYPHPPQPTNTPSPTPTPWCGVDPCPTSTPTPSWTPTPTPTCGGSPYMWRIVPSANPGTADNILHGVAARPSGDAWAVGVYGQTNQERAFLEQFDGRQWNAVPANTPAPSPGGYGRYFLQAVTFINDNDGWAVGQWWDTSTYKTLMLHWDGALWTYVPSPNPGTGIIEIDGVSGSASNDVWAVGSYWAGSGNPYRSLTLHWNGSQWSVVPNPLGAANYPNFLKGVSSLAPDNAWVVGYYANGPVHDLIMHWDGTQWRAIQGAGALTYLYGITALSDTNIWAVGYIDVNNNGQTINTYVEHWNGTQWSTVFSPNSGSQNYLYSMDALSPTDIWAVGYYVSYLSRTLVLHWDGGTWQLVASPNTSLYDDNVLNGVAAVSTTNVHAVGKYGPSGQARTLAMQYSSGPCGTGTPTPTPTWTPTPTGTLPTATNTPLLTLTPAGSVTITGTPCSINFTDVSPTDYFYQAVTYLYCHGAISGYADNTFRPYNNTTRGQLSKIVVLAEGWQIDTTGGPYFTDVPVGSAFYPYVETAYNQGIISGYADNTFRPNNNITRGQLTKVIVLAETWAVTPPSQPTFRDVPTNDPFYGYIETAYAHGIISGYSCGTDCLAFRPGNNATRGQISKIAYLAVTAP